MTTYIGKLLVDLLLVIHRRSSFRSQSETSNDLGRSLGASQAKARNKSASHTASYYLKKPLLSYKLS